MSASFDISSEVDMQEVLNAANQARKEIKTRYDFKESRSSIDLDGTTIKLISDDEFKMKAVREILEGRLAKRGVSLKALIPGKIVEASHQTVRQEITLQQGIPIEKAREITKTIKGYKKKSVQASIQGDKVRVTGKSRDLLQEVIGLLRSKDFGIDLDFGNYRG